MSRYEILLLDADGTLFDFDRAEREALRGAMERLGLPFDDRLWEDYHAINLAHWKRLERGEISLESLKWRRFRELYDLHGYNADPHRTQELYEGLLGGVLFEFDDALPACRRLRESCRLFLVTNGTSRVQRSKFALSTIPAMAENIFISEDMGAPKPHRQFFDRVFASIPGFDPKKALIVGDSLTSDIQGGINAGIDTCYLNRSGRLPEAPVKATFEIRSLAELPAIVEGRK